MAILIALGAALGLGCGLEEDRDAVRTHPVTVRRERSDPPIERIVSLSPIASALLVELDEIDRLVLVDAESQRRPELASHARLPDDADAALEAIRTVGPDLALVPVSRWSLIQRLRALDVDVLEIDVHDFDDAFASWRALGALLGRHAEVHARILDLSRPLAELAVESYGRPRPRLAALVSVEPLVLAGDHTFVGGLIEMAGGENVTHGWREQTHAVDRPALQRLAPVLLVHASPQPLAEPERMAMSEAMQEIAPVAFLRFDPVDFSGPAVLQAVQAIRERLPDPVNAVGSP